MGFTGFRYIFRLSKYFASRQYTLFPKVLEIQSEINKLRFGSLYYPPRFYIIVFYWRFKLRLFNQSNQQGSLGFTMPLDLKTQKLSNAL